ncbi:hypothetical protein L9F63_026244 [Diploptera punctata]|uniref:Uncharacterized protein n=1 Tax=Diploptera punctata TaxID=6984 RepID=A0AAD8AK24_DIPPU|nr:hypothetical protein L9F63_007752 [Diploptera punctata]KAJ9600618.1 hypothetical protein L9F63_026244 [Diploptera punctata]
MAPASVPCQCNEGVNATSLEVMTDLGIRAVKNISPHFNNSNEMTDVPGILENVTFSQDGTFPQNGNSGQTGSTFPDEFKIIKAVVLAAVTVVILISVCKMVFQLFVRYTVKHDKN